MKEAYAIGILAEFTTALKLIDVKDVLFRFDTGVGVVIFTYQSRLEIIRLVPTDGDKKDFLIKFRSFESCIAGSRETFWWLVKSRYTDLDFPELESELELMLESRFH